MSPPPTSAPSSGIAAAKLANTPNGGDRVSKQSANLQTGAISQADAAKMLNTSERNVASGAKLLKEAPELAAAVGNGKLSMHLATQVPQPLAERTRHRSGTDTRAKPGRRMKATTDGKSSVVDTDDRREKLAVRRS